MLFLNHLIDLIVVSHTYSEPITDYFIRTLESIGKALPSEMNNRTAHIHQFLK